MITQTLICWKQYISQKTCICWVKYYQKVSTKNQEFKKLTKIEVKNVFKNLKNNLQKKSHCPPSEKLIQLNRKEDHPSWFSKLHSKTLLKREQCQEDHHNYSYHKYNCNNLKQRDQYKTEELTTYHQGIQATIQKTIPKWYKIYTR